jgi:hypothetical protein
MKFEETIPNTFAPLSAQPLSSASDRIYEIHRAVHIS